MSSGIVVTVEHVQQAGLCVRGARAWFARYALDFREFMAHGTPVETIEATGDALGFRACDVARRAAEAAVGGIDGR